MEQVSKMLNSSAVETIKKLENLLVTSPVFHMGRSNVL